ncbi:LuxR C-terminal-related transcriptional regulator [Kocuria sp.]|uniref:helix-turn-helix transcriptional regulator n=1 Tax=Kocuria sp. TaxID=1871328 RepID=UPI0028A949D5|nr:LuxR C-terminal-related transcriptional regulator [Kocuria sp.]
MSQTAPRPRPTSDGTEPRILVGLDPAVDRLHESLREARRAHVQSVLISGGFGMGKTALMCKFANQISSSARAPRILRAQGDRWESQLQLAAYSQLMMTSPVRSGKGYDSDLPETEVSSHPLSPDRIVNHAATLGTHLEALQHRAPVVVMIDDVHWLDESSLRILSFVMRRMHARKVMFVLALDRIQAQGVPPGVLDNLTGYEVAQIALGPLTPALTQELSRRRFGMDLSSTAAHELVRHTRGNPQQINELLREMPPETWHSWFPALPASSRVRARVGGILGSASPDLLAVAEAAALLGDSSSLSEIADVSEVHGKDRLLAALDEGHRAGLLTLELKQVSSHVKFFEPAAAEAIYDHMVPGRRVELHQRASRAVAEEARRLGHLVSSVPSADPELARELQSFAHGQALQGSWHDAAGALLSASRLTLDVRARNDLLLRAVDAIIGSGNVAEAKAWITVVDEMPSSALRSSVLGYLSVVNGQNRSAENQLSSAWRSVNVKREPETAAQIAQRHVLWGVASWNGPAMIEWGERALSLTDSSTPAFIETEAIYGLGLFSSGRLDDARRAYDRAFELCSENAQQQRVEMGAGWLALRTEEVETAQALFESSGPTKVRGGSLRISLWAEAWLARTQLILGHWDAAAATVTRAAAQLETVQMTMLRPLLYWTAAELYSMRGDWELARYYVSQSAVPNDSFVCMSVPSLLAKARFHEARGDYEGSLECMTRVAEIDPWTAERVSFWPWQDTYVNALVMTGELDRAQAFLDEFEAVPRPHHIPSDQARLKWARARLLAAQGETEAAKDHFEDALNEIRTINRPYLRARISFAFGQSMRRAGKRRLASSVLRAARDIYEMLGAHSYVQRCDRELKASGVEPEASPDPADPVLAAVQRERLQLTPQETSVAQLVAGGATNKEVASQLFIAEKTVQYHLTRIYTKFGIRSRSELAARYREQE